MDAALYRADLEAKPEALGALADFLDRRDPFDGLPEDFDRIVFLGMGSSRFAARAAAQRLRAAGIDAVAEYASASLGTPPGPRTVAVAISATGGSRETLDALARHTGRSFVVAMTNTPGSPVTQGADLVVPMVAGEEHGGVACRTFQHTLALLLSLAATLPSKRNTAGPGSGSLARGPAGKVVADTVRRAAEATADLLDRRGEWLADAAALLDGPDGVYMIAPAERLSSAEQSALMVREGPRRQADACETGDWAHIDVYLTKTRDYRAIVFPGSPYDEQAMDWVRKRGSTVLTVGGELAGQAGSIRYRHDDDPDVALLTETLVAELIAAAWWERG